METNDEQQREEDSQLPAPLCETPREGLEELFGYEEFRPGQERAIRPVAQGGDALVVMPTGSGKSLCYQLAACLVDGVSIIVSPLIALMKDQVASLTELDLEATYINSSLGSADQRDRIAGIVDGDYKLAYVAPERFDSQRFLEALEEVDVGLLAVDEAHCISQWGHDFRPDYLRLSEVRNQLGSPPTIALTATATRQVQRDILAQLEMPEADVQVAGFERPNLYFEVHRAGNHEAKLDRINQVVDHWDGESIVIYAATRKNVETIAHDLAEEGRLVRPYHAGLKGRRRQQIQEAWMRGQIPVLVATKAFGMGVDKADVRAIVHYEMPGSVEAYYQEAGRAGRDGQPANCVLLYGAGDRGIHDWFREKSYPTREQVERVWRLLGAIERERIEFDAGEMADALSGMGPKVHPMAVESCIRLLERGGHVTLEGSWHSETRWLDIGERCTEEELQIDWEEHAERRDLAEQQVDKVVRYAGSSRCRQGRLLLYFEGEVAEDYRCGNCDVCAGPPDYVRRKGAKLVPTDEAEEALVAKLLSGVARCDQQFGRHKVAAMLGGEDRDGIDRHDLDEKPTWGILAEMAHWDIVYLLDVLIECGLVTRNRYKCVMMTGLGVAIMRGEAEWPDKLVERLGETLVAADTKIPAERRPGRRAA